MLVRMTIIKKWWTREMTQELRARIFPPQDPRFDFQHPHGSSELSTAPVGADLMSSMETRHTHGTYTDIHAKKSPKHIKYK